MPSLYIVQTKECVLANLPIHKPGRSDQPFGERTASYGKNSKTILEIKVNNSRKLETIVLNEFKKKFIHRTDYGTEYYEGDVEDMKKTMLEIIKNNDDAVQTFEPKIITEKTKKKMLICKTCEFYSDKRSNFIKHMKTDKHKQNVISGYVPETVIKHIECDYCKAIFNNTKLLVNHIKVCVQNPNNTQCKYCNIIFSKDTSYFNHLEACLNNKIMFLENKNITLENKKITLENKNIVLENKNIESESNYKNKIIELETNISELQVSNDDLNKEIKKLLYKKKLPLKK